MWNYIKKNWLGILGLTIGIIGIFLSYYFYTQSIKTREPIFATLSNRALFSSPKGLSSKYIKLIKLSDGKELSKNIYVEEVVFWNNGQEVIKTSHILNPLLIKFDKKVEIIDAFITEMNRPNIINGKINFIPGGNEISLKFNILEKNDGIKIQIVYTSLNSYNAKLKGIIEGVKEIKDIAKLSKENIFLGIAKVILYAIGFIGLIGLIIFIMGYIVPWISQKIFGKYYKKITLISGKLFEKLLQIFLFAFIIIIFVMFFIQKIYKLAEESAMETVPIMIKIDSNKTLDDE